MSNHDLPDAGAHDVGAHGRAPLPAPLPEGWEVVRLAGIFKPIRKEEREVIIQDENWYSLVTVRLYAKGLVLRSKQQGYKIGTKRLFKLSEGDFVFSKIDARNGGWGFVPYHLAGCLVSGDFPILQLNSDLADQDFIYFALSRPAVWSSLRNVAIGTTGRKRVRTESLQELLLPLPPLPEQRAIAHVLRTVQRAKEATERVIAAARELKKSLMRHLFTYGPVPLDQTDQVRLKETEIGPLPEEWEVVKLGEVVNRSEQVDPRRTPNRMFKYVDVSSIERENLRIAGYLQFKGGKAPSRARKLVKTDDVIFATVRPYLKRVAMVPSELDGQVCSTAFCVLRAKPDIVDPRFLFHATCSDRFVTAVGEHQRGSSYPAVTDSDVKRTAIPLPPLPEQRAIAEMLRAVDSKIAAEERRKAALDALFKTLLHHLMTGKVRVAGAIDVGAQRRCAPTDCAPTDSTTRCAPTDCAPTDSTTRCAPTDPTTRHAPMGCDAITEPEE